MQNLKLKQQKAYEAKVAAEQLAAAKDLANVIAAKTVTLKVKVGEGGRLFGAVTAKEISECLSQQHGVNIAKAKLVLDEPIKSCGGYQVKAKLGYEVTGIVNVVVTEEK